MNPLTPIEQQQVSFYDDTIPAVRMSDGTIYVALKPICENIGIAWSPQRSRLASDPILSEKMMSVTFVVIDIDPNSKRPHTSEMIALPLQFMHGWLFRIDSRRVKETVRGDLIRYQERCYAVLADAFNPSKSAVGRLWELYKKAGRSDDWIVYRLRGKATRDELTDEWAERGIENERDYAILTDEISKGTFSLTTAEHKELKALESRHVLRDHMSNIELILTALGEESTTQIARNDNAQGFEQNRKAAQDGGAIAGDARCQLEARTGQKVISQDNFLPNNEQPQLVDPDTNL